MDVEIIDNNNNLKENIRADILRHSIEAKGLLSQKGDIYVGTGESLTVLSKEGEVKIPKIRKLSVGSDGQIMVLKEINGNIDVAYDYVPPTLMPSYCNISVNYAENSDLCVEAETAECADFALPPSSASGERSLSLSLLNTKNHMSFSDTVKVPLRITGTTDSVGNAQITRAYCEGNFLYFLLTIVLYNGASSSIGTFLVNGGTAAAVEQLFSKASLFTEKGNIVAEGFFPSAVVPTLGGKKGQAVPIRYVLNKNGNFSISVDPLSFSPKTSDIPQQEISVALCIDLKDRS